MRKRRTTKGQRSRVHSKRRALYRYGVVLNHEKYAAAIEDIRTNKNKGMKKSLNRSLHIITVDGVEMLVVYDKRRKELITVLPEDSNLFNIVKEKTNAANNIPSVSGNSDTG